MITEEARARMGWKKGRKFTAYEKVCEVCGKTFTTVPTSSKQFCCSRKCSWIRRTKERVHHKCAHCGKDILDIKKSTGKRYCSTECKIKALAENRRKKCEKTRIWGKWYSYREAKKYLLERYKKCMKCGYQDRVDILELHHKDRNRKNNVEENLLLLCPNCHTIEHIDAGDGQFRNNRGRKDHAVNE